MSMRVQDGCTPERKEATMSQKITPFIWFIKDAEAAAKRYVSLFPNSKVVETTKYPEGVPGAEPGTVMTVEFELNGQPFTALNGGPGVFEPSGQVSFVVHCKDQGEVDHYWDGLLEGGTPSQCGWLTDRFGVTWQVTPDRLIELMTDPDKEAANRVMQAMMQMIKIDIATLEKAYAG
jgi:predicted 3-demethylubiquinone-9 3-methyltransferase (glyoxalase superfamily)